MKNLKEHFKLKLTLLNLQYGLSTHKCEGIEYLTNPHGIDSLESKTFYVPTRVRLFVDFNITHMILLIY